MSATQPAFARDPITWSRQERAAQYLDFAMRYRNMADAEERPGARAGLLELARECEAAAERCRKQI